LDFFDNKPGGFAAARFVALTLLMDESQDMFYLMKWTQGDLKKYSKELMDTLHAKAKEIRVNPYFHSRMLNLVHQLELSSGGKLAFYGKTIQSELGVDEKGNLSPDSLALETALVLAKQTQQPSQDIAPYIQQAIGLNQSENNRAALAERVLTYYPELRYLFAN
tara:strand:+ start:8532 stop:9023 length:492 start_codon:yes stop_codon:yes gene_type:complete